MAEEPSDTAFWDVSGTLLGDLRSKLKHRTVHQGGKIMVESGDWLGQRLVIGMPKRLIQRHAPRLAESLAAMIAAHRPRRLFVVGPAAAVSKTLAIGQVVQADDSRTDEIGDGILRAASAVALVTTDWADKTRQASDELGVQLGLLGVVTMLSDRPEVVPPSSHRRTLSHNAGAMLGHLLAGRVGSSTVPAAARAALVDAIEAMLRVP